MLKSPSSPLSYKSYSEWMPQVLIEGDIECHLNIGASGKQSLERGAFRYSSLGTPYRTQPSLVGLTDMPFYFLKYTYPYYESTLSFYLQRDKCDRGGLNHLSKLS